MTDMPVTTSRRVDWLELFFDLVFVVIIKQLTDVLHGQPHLADFAKVVGLFAVVWIAWLNVTSFVNLSNDSSIDRRIPVLVSMAGVGLIAVSIPEATGSGALLFVLGLTLARVAVWPLWIKVNTGIPRGRVRATIYGPGIALVWLASLLVPEAVRPWVWVGLVIGELAYSASGFAAARFGVSHLLERVGLFVMIVLGESVVELILAVHLKQSAIAWIVSAGAFILVCAIWWHHYQAGAPLAERMLGHSSGVVLRDVIVVAHFFIVLGLIGIAAGLGSAIEHADDGHLPYGSVVALGAGIGSYHLAYLIIAWRYGIRASHLVLLTLLGAVVVTVAIVFGVGWPAWLLVLLLLVYMLVDRLLSPLVAGNLLPASRVS
jgi:low temperature requirement protein LtrA